MEIGETVSWLTRNLVVSGAMLGVVVSGGMPAGAEEAPNEGTMVVSPEIVGEPSATTQSPPETAPPESRPNEDTEDGLDALGDGLQAFGMFLFVMTAVGFFNGTDSSTGSRRRPY